MQIVVSVDCGKSATLFSVWGANAALQNHASDKIHNSDKSILISVVSVLKPSPTGSWQTSFPWGAVSMQEYGLGRVT